MSGPAGREMRTFAGRSCKFKILNSRFKNMLGLQPAEHASSATNCGPPPGGGCGPLGPNGPIPTRDKPAAERTGLRRGGAALRPGLQRPGRRKFKIQNFIQGYSLRSVRKFGHELRASEEGKWPAMSKNGEFRDTACGGYACDLKEQRASAAPGCGPLGPGGPILNSRPARPLPADGLHLRVPKFRSYSPSARQRAFAVVQSCRDWRGFSQAAAR